MQWTVALYGWELLLEGCAELLQGCVAIDLGRRYPESSVSSNRTMHGLPEDKGRSKTLRALAVFCGGAFLRCFFKLMLLEYTSQGEAG